GAVVRAVPHLANLELRHVDAELGDAPRRGAPRVEIRDVDAARLAERLERDPRDGPLRMRRDRRAADAGQLELAEGTPVAREDLDAAMRVGDVVDADPPRRRLDVDDHGVLALGNDLAERLGRIAGEIERDHALVR